MAPITTDKSESPADDLPEFDEEKSEEFEDEEEEFEEENVDADIDPQPHLLDPSYEAAVRSAKKIRGIIIGESPYAEDDGPTDVPFMTRSWEQLRNPLCSGQYVVQSVTGTSIYPIAKRRATSSPMEFATECLLGKYGVVLLNAAYALPTRAELMAQVGLAPQGNKEALKKSKNKCRRERKNLIDKRMNADWTKNGALLQALKPHRPLVVLCGARIETQLGSNIRALFTSVDDVINPCHPATYNVHTPSRYVEWLRYWDVGRMNEILKGRK